MPTFLIFHTNYWENSDTSVTPIAPPGKGGYPLWQSSVIAPSGLGMLGAWWDTWKPRLKWWRAFAPRVHRLRPEQRAVLERVLVLLESPEYGHARKAVRQTAVILGFNKPSAWGELKVQLQASPGHSENLMRHLEAVKRLRAYSDPSTLSNPTANLLTELAYDGFGQYPRTPY